jgi:hypothetical protein
MEYPYRVFYVKKTFFVGINAKDLKESRLDAESKNRFPDKPSSLWRIRESVQAFPHLPFILVDEVIPTCPPFEPLQIIVVNKNGRPAGRYGKGCYGLSAERCQGWKSLEEKLTKVAEGLLYFAKKFNNVQYVTSFKPLSSSHLPSAWKYDMDFPTEYEALAGLHHALAGYQMLMALVSYGIMLCRTDEDAPGHPRWAAFLQDRYKVEAVFVDAIKASPLNDFTCCRAGSFVTQDSVDHSWVSHIRYMEDALCPIYIHWPSDSSWGGAYAQVMAKYKPPVELIRQAQNPWLARIRAPSPSVLSSSDTYDRPGSSLATTVPDDGVDVFRDEPDDYAQQWPEVGASGQRPGETMDDFFSRQQKQNLRALMKLDAKGHQVVRQRETGAKSHPIPGKKKGPAVYVWLPNMVTGWVKRVWVTKERAQDAFLSFNNAARRFDAVTNSWDCYSGWAPDTAPDPRFFEDDDDDDGSFFIPMPPVSSAPPPQPITANDAVMEDLVQSSATGRSPLAARPPSPGVPPLPAPVPSSPLPLPLSSLAVPPLPATVPSLHILPPTANDAVMEDLIQSSATGRSPSAIRPPSPVVPPSPPPLTSSSPVVSPPATVVNGNYEDFMNTLHYRFGFLWDGYEDEVEDGEVLGDTEKRIRDAMRTFVAHGNGLDPRYHRRFLTFSSMLSSQGVTESQLWDLKDSNPRCLQRPSISDDQFFSIATLRPEDGRVFYDVKPPKQQEFLQEFFHLLSPTASTAVECYRRHFSSISDAARHLVDTGKSFRTFMKPMRPPQYSRPKAVELPHREKSYSFSHLDFVSYEGTLERFFQHPHARAALLEGGILWRLGMEYLDPQAAISGPSDYANDFGERISLPDEGTFVDDSLTEDERDLICGTYAVYTGDDAGLFSCSFEADT